MIPIQENLAIDEAELVLTAARSSGPGGQNVNKVNTRVTLWFDVARSPSLTDDQKRRIFTRQAGRISKDGRLRIVVQETASQAQNRQIAIDRFVALIRTTLKRTPVRRKTRVPPAARRRRLEEKKHRSRTKQRRTQTINHE